MKPRPMMHRLRALRRGLLGWLARPGVLGPVSGGLLLLAFPPLEWTPVAWVALAPLLTLLEAEGNPLRRRGARVWFGAGWGMGLVLSAGHYHWMIRAMVEVAGVPVLRFVPFWLTLVASFALGPALALAGCAWARARLGWALWWTAPVAFMLLDALLLHFPFGGMPWGSWAGTQPDTLAAAWAAPVLGGPGVVALVVAVNAGWAALAEGSGPVRRSISPTLGAALLAAVMAVLIWPNAMVTEPPPEGQGLRALLVPSDLNVPTPDESSQRLRHYIGRTLAAAGQNRRMPVRQPPVPLLVVVWPESAAAGDVSRGKSLVQLHDVAALVEGDILFGSDTRDLGRDFNSLYLVSSGTFDFQRYDKRDLVPFGEYVPALFKPMFGRKATSGEQDYAAGDRPPVLSWQGRTLGVAICFESTLPDHMTAAVRDGAQVLVVIANDAWLTPAARTHHLRLTALRALESGRDVLFVSNGGWSAHLSGGRVVRSTAANGAPFQVEARLDAHLTPWVRWGGTLPFAAAALVLLIRLIGYGVALVLRPRSTRLPLR